MVTAPIALALLGFVTLVAIAVASAAVWQAHAARAALRAAEATPADRTEIVELDRQMESESRRAGDIAHDLNDLLMAITGHTELLIASLDPAGASILDAYEIRTAALKAAQLTRPLRTLCSSPRAAGPTYTIELPAFEPAAPLASVAPPTPALPPVLVVEDEPGVRELIKAVLLRAGHEVVAVAGPHDALAVLRRRPAFALMLVDIVMPEMDGYDMVAEARVIAPGVRVVFMSAFARDPTRLSSGDGFLAKPFTAETLTAIVGDALAGR